MGQQIAVSMIESEKRPGYWLVRADFGDGRPVIKGPMSLHDAQRIVAELHADLDKAGLKPIDPSEHDAQLGATALVVAGCVFLLVLLTFLAVVTSR